MYTGYFNLLEAPFSITPDPHFFFLSHAHQEALAHLVYGVLGDNDGFVLLTGEVGTGKTTVCRAFINQLPEHVDVALALNPMVSVNEFLLGICDELGVPIDTEQPSRKHLVDHLNQHLLHAHAVGRRVVLIVDEAQNLDVELLEQIRLLTNLETEKHKLLQVFLVGQPELRELIAHKGMRQVAQRITARYHLGPLNRRETGEYILHRIHVAGAQGIKFTPGALRLIYRSTGGVPRLINILCDRALLGAFTLGQHRVNRKIIRSAMKEMLLVARSPLLPWLAFSSVGFAALFIMLVTARYDTELNGWLTRSDNSLNNTAVAQSTAVPMPRVSSTPENILELPATGNVVDHSILPDNSPAMVEKNSVETEEEAAVTNQGALKALVTDDLEQGDDGILLTSINQPEFVDGSPTPITDVEISPTELANDTPAIPMPFQGKAAPEAYQFLAEGWNLRLEGGDYSTFCDSMAIHGLRCLKESGSFSKLLRYDRPALVNITKDDHKYIAVLMGYDGKQVSLNLGGELVNLSVDEIDRRRWSKDYLILWEPPEGFVSFLRSGSRNRMAVWVNATLNMLDGGKKSEVSDLFGVTEAEQIKRFQRSNALDPDGIVGARTAIVLQNRRADFKGPRLSDPLP